MQPRADLLALGEALQRARARKDWSRKELARQSGVSDQTIMRAELGRRGITTNQLWDIANALGTRMSQLFREAELEPDADL